jgi:Methyltransferase domain
VAATVPASIERAFTPLDHAMLREHRRRLLGSARGRVLDLGGSGATNLAFYSAGAVDEIVLVGVDPPPSPPALPLRLVSTAEVTEVYDTIVATFALSDRQDPDDQAVWIRDHLAADGWLLFLDRGPARRRLIGDVTRSLHRLRGDDGRPVPDVPNVIRRAGLTITTLDRFGLTTLTLSLRSLASGRARHRKLPASIPRPET